MDLSPEEAEQLLDAALAETDETDAEFAARARIEAFTDDASKAPMSELITWRGRLPDDLAPILEDIIEHRRLNPDL